MGKNDKKHSRAEKKKKNKLRRNLQALQTSTDDLSDSVTKQDTSLNLLRKPDTNHDITVLPITIQETKIEEFKIENAQEENGTLITQSNASIPITHEINSDIYLNNITISDGFDVHTEQEIEIDGSYKDLTAHSTSRTVEEPLEDYVSILSDEETNKDPNQNGPSLFDNIVSKTAAVAKNIYNVFNSRPTLLNENQPKAVSSQSIAPSMSSGK